MSRTVLVGVAALALGGAAGCRGQQSALPPIRVFDDMDEQQKFLPQSENGLFEDHRAMRPIIEGTVAQGQLDEDTLYYKGAFEGGGAIAKIPLPVDEKLVRRGQERFNIYCAPCHDRTGAGRGIVVQRGFHIPVDLASAHTRGIGDGEIFQIITNGVRNMPAYAVQIPVQDRWAIVSWVRVLQRSQAGAPSDIPAGAQVKPANSGTGAGE